MGPRVLISGTWYKRLSTRAFLTPWRWRWRSGSPLAHDQRRAATAEWTERIRTIMDEGNARDPVEVLPTIIACLLEEIRGVARDEAEMAARGTVQKMLKRCMVPL